MMYRPFETDQELRDRKEKIEQKRKQVTSLSIDNIRVEDVGVVLEAIKELGLDIEINV